jgi:hypothetical protein
LERCVSNLKKLQEDLGNVLVGHIKDLKTPRERRSFLAAIVKKHQRKNVCCFLNIHINRQEWKLIHVHAKFPGAFEPVEKQPIHRMRLDKEILKTLIQFLDSPGNLQKYAFGSQLWTILSETATVHLDNVARMKKIEKLSSDFIFSLKGELDLLESSDQLPEDRCKKMEPATFRRCAREKNHEGNCKFAQQGSISSSTVQYLIYSLMSGDIKSLSGLDDVKVQKVRDNFICLQEIAEEA